MSKNKNDSIFKKHIILSNSLENKELYSFTYNFRNLLMFMIKGNRSFVKSLYQFYQLQLKSIHFQKLDQRDK